MILDLIVSLFILFSLLLVISIYFTCNRNNMLNLSCLIVNFTVVVGWICNIIFKYEYMNDINIKNISEGVITGMFIVSFLYFIIFFVISLKDKTNRDNLSKSLFSILKIFRSISKIRY